MHATPQQACSAYAKVIGGTPGKVEYIENFGVRCHYKDRDGVASTMDTIAMECPWPSRPFGLGQCECMNDDVVSGDKCVSPNEAKEQRPPSPVAAPNQPAGPPPAAPERGMTASDDQHFRELASRHKLFILVRESNASAVRWIGKQGYLPKPELLKAKTRKTGADAGLVVADPNDAQLIESLQAASPPMTYAQYVAKLKEYDFVVGPGPRYLVSHVKRKAMYYSDYDLHGVYDASGKPAFESSGFRKLVNARTAHDMVQHGPHDDWKLRNSPDQAGPNAGPQPPVIAYKPDKSAEYLKTVPELRAFYQRNRIPWPYHPRFGP